MDDLILMMQRVFSKKISMDDEITIKYTDDGAFSFLSRIYVLSIMCGRGRWRNSKFNVEQTAANLTVEGWDCTIHHDYNRP